MERQHEKTVVVAGGTGHVGSRIVAQLLDHGASVVVPSRSVARLAELRELLGARLGPWELGKLRTLVIPEGEHGVASLAARIEGEHGPLWSVVAALGRFRPAAPLLDSTPSQLRQVLEDHLLAHFIFAKTFLPRLRLPGSKYIFVNGPLAIDPGPGCALGLVATASAGQHIMFRALADELEQSPAKLLELVVYASVHDGETHVDGGISAEDIGARTVRLLADIEPARHGQSIHLRSPLPSALPVH